MRGTVNNQLIIVLSAISLLAIGLLLMLLDWL